MRSSRPFGPSILVDSLNSQGVHDGGARLSADELTVYFFSNRLGGYDVFSATRPARSAAFSTPQTVSGLNTAAYDDFPSPTADGLTMYIETNRTGTYQIFVASRMTLTDAFLEAAPVANINAGPVDAFPFVRPDNSGLYFSSNRGTAIGGYDVYLAERGANGQFGVPMLVSTVNSTLNEWAPVPSFDEQAIYFASDRTDPAAKGAYDIWMARRSSRTASFDPPVILQEVNTDDEDIPSWISPDNCRLYVTHMVNKWRKIYVAERTQ